MPQGSVLLFLIYVSDICKSSEILSLILFADDTVTVIKLFFNNVSKQLQQMHSKNGRLHSLNYPHVITAPKSWGEARLVS